MAKFWTNGPELELRGDEYDNGLRSFILFAASLGMADGKEDLLNLING